MQIRADNKITRSVADQALVMLEIDRYGLDEMDKRLLETLVHKFSGGPVGLNSLAVSIGEEPDTIEEVYEPYLIQEGYLQRTPQGRLATACVMNVWVWPRRIHHVSVKGIAMIGGASRCIAKIKNGTVW